MRAVLCFQATPLGCGALSSGDHAAPAVNGAARMGPILELAPDGLIYKDLSGCPDWPAATHRAHALLADLHTHSPGGPALPGAGLAPGRFTARCAAALATPGTLRVIPPGTE